MKKKILFCAIMGISIMAFAKIGQAVWVSTCGVKHRQFPVEKILFLFLSLLILVPSPMIRFFFTIYTIRQKINSKKSKIPE